MVKLTLAKVSRELREGKKPDMAKRRLRPYACGTNELRGRDLPLFSKTSRLLQVPLHLQTKYSKNIHVKIHQLNLF